MTDEQTDRATLGPSPSFNEPKGFAGEKPKTPKVDHIAEIATLANAMTLTSPSGVETIRDKILQHCADINDPKAYEERVAAEKKAHDEAEAAAKKVREAARPKVA